MKENAMIDIETMGILNNAAIISIGVVMFNKDGIGFTFYKKVNLESCIKAGLSIDSATIIWWLKQPEEARKEFFDNKQDFSLKRALREMCYFLDIQDPKADTRNRVKEDLKVWGNGSVFDITILENALNVMNIPIPWRYNNIRCFRTYKAMNKNIINIPKDRSAHNALEDAIWQAEYAIEIMNERFVD